MNKKNIIYFVLLYVCIGCKTLIKHPYKIGHNIKFNTKEEYSNVIQKKYPKIWRCFLKLDSVSTIHFIQNELLTQPFKLYLGCYINDSMKCSESLFLSERPSCIGRIEKEILKNLDSGNLAKKTLVKGEKLSQYNFTYLYSGKECLLKDSMPSIHIFLLYTYSLGTYYDSLYKKIEDWQSRYGKVANFFIVSIDSLYRLHD